MSRPPLALQLLEDRCVPATFGIPWHDPSHLSLSFAPDGTALVGHTSQLQSTLDSQFDRADWQRLILQAFQSWAVQANINFGLKLDGGQAFGTPGLTQGDPRFGDIRIGAHAMTQEVLAIGVPFDPSLSGTWSGDVLFNSAHNFTGTPFSLQAVAMHEAGHALGLSNSSNPDSIMYSLYDRTRTTLSAEDISRIQALYGVRTADRYEGTANNDVQSRASSFLMPTVYQGETPLVAFGDLTTSADVDWFTFHSPPDGNDDANDRSVTIRLQSSGASLLAPKLKIVDSTGRVLRTATSASITGDVLQVQLTGLSSAQRYFIRVESASEDLFSVGRYGLSVRFDKTSGTSDELIGQMLSGPFEQLSPDAVDSFFRTGGDFLITEEYGSNDTLATAQALTASSGYTNTRFEAISTLSKKEDVDLFVLTAPSTAGSVLTATVWTTNTEGFSPTIAVLNQAGQAVPMTVLANGNGTSTVQVTNAQPGERYYLRVTLNAQANEDKGNYFVSAGFGAQAAPLQTFAQGSLSATKPTSSSQLYVAQTQLFHFVLTAGNQTAGASIRMTIVNANGAIVHELTAQAGQSVSGSSVLLTPGAYTVRFQVENPNGSQVTYTLQGANQSNPIGPVPLDPLMTSQYTSGTYPGTYFYPGFSVPYDPTLMPGYINPNNPATWPPGFVPTPDMYSLPWLIRTDNPFYWIPATI